MARDRGTAGSSLNGITVLCPWARHIYPCLVLVHPRKAHPNITEKLEDLKVMNRSPDLLNNVNMGQGQLRLIMKHILFNHIWGLHPFWSSELKQSNENSIKQPSDFWEKMLWPWIKGHRSAWHLVLIKKHCLVRFNISRKYYDFGLNSYRKMNISRFSLINALGIKFDLAMN